MRQLKLSDDIIKMINDKVNSMVNMKYMTQDKINISVDIPKVKANKATIEFTEPAIKKIKALVTECSKEVAWHAMVEKIAKGHYRIYDIIVFPQTVTACTVTSDEEKYTQWVMALEDEEFFNMKCHMHSHVNMGVAPSGVDINYQNEMLTNVEKFYIFMIWNKKGDNWTNIYDFEDNICYEDKDIKLSLPELDYSDWAKQAIKEYVAEPVMNKPTASWKEFQQTKAAKEVYQQMKLKEIEEQKLEEDYRKYLDEEFGDIYRGYMD